MIRKLTMQDTEQVLTLNAKTLGSSTLEATTATLYRLLQQPNQHYVLGYEMDGQLVGYIHAQRYEMLYSPYVFLDVISLAIDDDYQGNGIGKQLIHAVEEQAKDLRLDGIRINSGNNREKAHGFYERLGYVSEIDQKRYMKIFAPISV